MKDLFDISSQIYLPDLTRTARVEPVEGKAFTVRAFIEEGSDPGQESGKGLTREIRGVVAGFSRICIKIKDYECPQLEDKIHMDEKCWKVTSVEDSKGGDWILICKTNDRARRKL
jgi:hypothetical protein